MKNHRRPFGSGTAPTILQVLLATILGVLIGVIFTKFAENKVVHHALQKETMLSQLQQTSNNISEGAKKMTIVPTLEHRMNLLLMGVDSNGAGTKRWANTRSDTMVIVSLDPERKRVGMVSIPRDSRVTIEKHGVDKINAAHAFGGPDLAVSTVEDNFNVPIDHYIVIDVQGLRKVFEALGPIDVLVEKRMHYNDWTGHLHVALEPGWHKLTPIQAEEYVRFRHDAKGDIGRIERQQWFLRQLTNKFKEPQVILKLPELFKIANDYVVTDLPADDMAKIANFGKDIRPQQVISGTVPGRAVCIRGGSYWEPDTEAAAIVFNRLLGTPMSSGAVATESTSSDAANSAFAATRTPDTVEKISVTLKYGKDATANADDLAKELTAAGYKVKNKIRGESADCQHDEIVQTSLKADEIITEKMQSNVPKLADFPVVLNLDEKAPTDFTIVVSPGLTASAVATPIDANSLKEKKDSEEEFTAKPKLTYRVRRGRRKRVASLPGSSNQKLSRERVQSLETKDNIAAPHAVPSQPAASGEVTAPSNSAPSLGASAPSVSQPVEQKSATP